MIATGSSGAGATGVASILRGTIVVEKRLAVEGRLSIGVWAIDVCVAGVEVCVGIIPEEEGIRCHYGYGWFCGSGRCNLR
jgi:hypothetical protein